MLQNLESSRIWHSLEESQNMLCCLPINFQILDNFSTYHDIPWEIYSPLKVSLLIAIHRLPYFHKFAINLEWFLSLDLRLFIYFLNITLASIYEIFKDLCKTYILEVEICSIGENHNQAFWHWTEQTSNILPSTILTQTEFKLLIRLLSSFKFSCKGDVSFIFKLYNGLSR